MPPESTIAAAILAKLRAIPDGYVFKVHGSEYQKAGVPDILFWKRTGSTALLWDDDAKIMRVVDLSIPFAFEVKTVRGRVSKIQEIQLERMERGGVICAVVRSVDEVRVILGSYGIEL